MDNREIPIVYTLILCANISLSNEMRKITATDEEPSNLKVSSRASYIFCGRFHPDSINGLRNSSKYASVRLVRTNWSLTLL